MSSSSPPPKKKKITLKSSDGEAFEVDEEVALQSVTIKDAIKVDGDNDNIVVTLGNVSGKILAKVIDYCRKHLETPKNEDDLEAWDAEFVKVDQNTLFDLIVAANSLHIKHLLDLTTSTVAGMIRGMTPEEIPRFFNIRNDFTPEEEEQIRRENQWAFD